MQVTPSLVSRAVTRAAVVVLSLLVGCDDGSPADAQRVDPGGERPEPAGARREEPDHPASSRSEPTAVALHMAGRYERVSEIRDAIVDGELRSATELARELAQPARIEGLPREASSHVIGVHVRAAELAEAGTLLDASAAFGSLMVACGECHASAGARLTVPSAPFPPKEPRAPGPMRRHEEALHEMWDGLLIGSSSRFDEGARKLADAPLSPPERRQSAELRRLAERARSYAQTATRGPGLAARAEQFGLLLSTCAECHAVAGR